jgi:hypothetical protein
MPGLLQKYDISSDTDEQLELALALLFTWDSKGANVYKTGVDKEGFSWLALEKRSIGLRKDWTPLPFPLDTKTKMFSFVRDWLSSASRGPHPHPAPAGSCHMGWHVTNDHNVWDEAIVKIEADWIVYGK